MAKLEKNAAQKFRHEQKYYMSWPGYAAAALRISGAMLRDVHTTDPEGYLVSSLYFDDYGDSAYRDKQDGVETRRKYRIRCYEGSDSFISLERKYKRGAYVYKQAARISREEYERILDGDYGFLLTNGQTLCQEFYHEVMSYVMRPKVIVRYQREAYVWPEGDVRVTFDKRLAASAALDLFDTGALYAEAMPADRVIMEVKFTQMIPQFLTDLIAGMPGDYAAASKYVMCRDVIGARL